MLDYAALRVVAAVADLGSFERAAARLGVTPSAVSQRVKQLEERLGTTLIRRGTPCTATETGAFLCRHLETVAMLEGDLLAALPGLAGAEEGGRPVTLPIATNADSLATWFLEPIARFTAREPFLVDIVVDDQDHTAGWLREGRVLAAVTSREDAVPGCRRHALGALRYHATASPEFVARHFPQGVTAEAIARAPALTFNRKDGLQDGWIRRHLGTDVDHPTHYLPSSHAFLDATLAGMGWAMNPVHLARDALATGRLVELLPGAVLDTPLHWQINRLAADRLAGLTREVRAAAGRELVQE